MDFTSAMTRFRRSFNKDGNGKRIAFMLTGGAYSTVDFRLTCGSSRFLEGCWDPYSVPQLIEYAKKSGLPVNEKDFHSVDGDTSVVYAAALMEQMKVTMKPGPEFPIIVASTAALTTNRFRRSENRAYVCVIRDVSEEGKIVEMDAWHISLDKLPESDHTPIASFPDMIDLRRREEDQKVSQAILALIMKDRKMLPELRKDESISLHRSSGTVETCWLFKEPGLKPCASAGNKLCWAEGVA